MFKHIYRSIALPFLAAIGVLYATNPVMALSIAFSFTSTSSTTSNGTVTGIINGLTAGATTKPTDIEVEANQIGVPSGTDLIYTSGSITLDSNGNVTAVNNVSGQNVGTTSIQLNAAGGENSLATGVSPYQQEYNFDGFTASAYTAVPTSAPWEGEAAVIPTMFGADLYAMRRRTRVAHRQTN